MKQNKQEKYNDTYSTGSTVPPKSYQGIIAALLILVTVLCSIVTVLGMMNIRLWNLLENVEVQAPEEENKVAMAQSLDRQIAVEESSILGMTCQEISGVYRSYNGWPDGLYISQIEPGSLADLGDIRPGDILVAVNGAPVTLQEELEQAVSQVPAEGVLKLTLYREEKQITVLLKVG